MSVGQECVNEVVSDVFRKPLDNRLIENEDLRQTCKDMRLTVTKNFKRQLEYLHYMLELHVRIRSFLTFPSRIPDLDLYIVDHITLQRLSDFSHLQDLIILCGPPLSCKSTLWQTVAAAFRYEVFCLPSVAFTEMENCIHLEHFFQSLSASKSDETLLLVCILFVISYSFW